MSSAQIVLAPLLSVNEPEAQVVEVLVRLGQLISAGDLLCVLSTTKANFDVQAETSGYIGSVRIVPGKSVGAGAVMFEIQAEPVEIMETPPLAAAQRAGALPEGVRITDKALKLARELHVDLNGLTRDILVTEAMVRGLAPVESERASVSRFVTQSNEVVIYGAGGHAKTIIDSLLGRREFKIAGVIADPVPAERQLLGVPILGGSEELSALYEKGVRLMINGVGGINSLSARAAIFERFAELGFRFPAVLHRSAIVEPSATIAAGAQIFGMAFVGSAATVGFGAIINTGVIVSHDCSIDDYAHLTPGVVLAGHVKVGKGALVGMGVTTNTNVTIGEWARIGNGARIHGDVSPHTVVQAGTTWPPAKS